ncbi:MAG: hypothetical protein UH249_02810, partial [Acutalibacteraceae bacterium]|nr:hypothetical protein [Acutalibacteraceae bacterium]
PPLPKGRWILRSKRRRDTFIKNIEISLFSFKISPSHDFVAPAPFRQGGLISAPLNNPTNPNLLNIYNKKADSSTCLLSDLK